MVGRLSRNGVLLFRMKLELVMHQINQYAVYLVSG